MYSYIHYNYYYPCNNLYKYHRPKTCNTDQLIGISNASIKLYMQEWALVTHKNVLVPHFLYPFSKFRFLFIFFFLFHYMQCTYEKAMYLREGNDLWCIIWELLPKKRQGIKQYPFQKLLIVNSISLHRSITQNIGYKKTNCRMELRCIFTFIKLPIFLTRFIIPIFYSKIKSLLHILLSHI